MPIWVVLKNGLGINFAHIRVLIDRNKKIQKLVDEKGKIPKSKIKSYVSGALDAYIN